MTALDRVRACGHTPISGEGAGPGLRITPDPKGGNIAGLSGLASCGSVWACPVCSAKIATRRAEDLADVMRFALGQGCRASMVTLTMRHHEGQTLKECWDALSKAWAAVTSGKQWRSDQAKYGFALITDHQHVEPKAGAACVVCDRSKREHEVQIPWVKAVEVTRGRNGWHVHVHALLIWGQPIPHDQAQHVGERMWRRWDRALQRNGFESLQEAGGLDVRMASLKPGNDSGLHEYFVKLSHEITGGQAKLAKGGGRTPFQMLTDALANGEAADVHAWWEWEKSSRGRRQIAWSKGLREWAGLGREQTDEEIAAEEPGGEDVLFLEPESWYWLRGSPDLVCDLLEAAERGGFEAAAAQLDAWGLSYLMLTLPPKPPPLPRDHEHWQLRRDRSEEAHALVGNVTRQLSEALDWQNLLRSIGG